MHIQPFLMKPSSFNDNIIYLCNEFSHRFTLTLTRKFAESNIDVTAEQFAILAVLWYKDGISQKEISENLKRDKTTIARVVNNMKKKGMVKRVIDANDNRAWLVSLTDEGRALQQKALNVSGMLYMQAIAGVDALYMQAGIKLMQQMLNNF